MPLKNPVQRRIYQAGIMARRRAAERDERHRKMLENIKCAKLGSERQLSWIAGLFEGEGTVTISNGGRKNNTRLLCSVTSTDRQIIEKFQTLLPGKNILRKFPNNPNAREAYTWRIEGQRALLFLTKLQPFFQTGRVQTKVTLAIKYQLERKLWQRRDVAYKERHERYRIEMRRLNWRGTKPCPF